MERRRGARCTGHGGARRGARRRAAGARGAAARQESRTAARRGRARASPHKSQARRGRALRLEEEHEEVDDQDEGDPNLPDVKDLGPEELLEQSPRKRRIVLCHHIRRWVLLFFTNSFTNFSFCFSSI